MKEKTIKSIIIWVILIAIFFYSTSYEEGSLSFILLIITAGIAWNYRDNNKKKEEELERCRKDWKFCKDLLDKERK